MEINDLLDNTKIKSSLFLFGVSFAILCLGVLMMSWSGVFIALGIIIGILGLVGSCIGGGASAGLYMDWVSK